MLESLAFSNTPILSSVAFATDPRPEETARYNKSVADRYTTDKSVEFRLAAEKAVKRGDTSVMKISTRDLAYLESEKCEENLNRSLINFCIAASRDWDECVNIQKMFEEVFLVGVAFICKRKRIYGHGAVSKECGEIAKHTLEVDVPAAKANREANKFNYHFLAFAGKNIARPRYVKEIVKLMRGL